MGCSCVFRHTPAVPQYSETRVCDQAVALTAVASMDVSLIKRSYLDHARVVHPDKNKGVDDSALKQLSAAFARLKDAYDELCLPEGAAVYLRRAAQAEACHRRCGASFSSSKLA